MTIYVGNLAAQTTEDEIRGLFVAFGQVSRVSIMTDKHSGRSRGYGFVEMDQAEEGRRAIAELGGILLGERPLTVSEARPRAASNGAQHSRAGLD